jgi:hypothetical protein
MGQISFLVIVRIFGMVGRWGDLTAKWLVSFQKRLAPFVKALRVEQTKRILTNQGQAKLMLRRTYGVSHPQNAKKLPEGSFLF